MNSDFVDGNKSIDTINAFDSVGSSSNTATPSEYPFLIKFHAVNIYHRDIGKSMGTLLNDIGITTKGSNMYCPFHYDELGGHPSAKYHPDSDMVYCFAESKLYTAYHVLNILYDFNMESIFRNCWKELTPDIKEELLTKYGEGVEIDVRERVNPVWKSLDKVLFTFKNHGVSFSQHKNALFKIMKLVYDNRGGIDYVRNIKK